MPPRMTITPTIVKQKRELRRAAQANWPPPVLSQSFYNPHFRRMSRYWGSMRNLCKNYDRAQPRDLDRRNAGAFRDEDAMLFSASARLIVEKLHGHALPLLRWSASNVVYAIFHANPQSRLPPSLLYVGKSHLQMHERFKQHVGKGKAWVQLTGTARKQAESYGLYRHIHHYGIQDLVIVPLEQIPVSFSEQQDDWKRESRKLERKWISWLRSLIPTGYNTMMPGTKQVSFSQLLNGGQHGPHLFDAVDQLYHEHEQFDASNSYTSRRYIDRLRHLDRLLLLHGPDWVGVHLREPRGRRGFRTRNVSRILQLACLHRVSQISVASQSVLRDLLATEMQRRYALARRQSGPRPNFTFLFESQLIDLLKIQSVLSDPALLQLLPQAIRSHPKGKNLCPRMAPKYPVPIGAQWINYKRVFDGTAMSFQEMLDLIATPFQGTGAGCFCHGLPESFRPEGHGGHVYTADPAFLTHMLPEHPHICHLFQKGAKFRPSYTQYVTEAHKARCMQQVEKGMHDFIEQLDRTYRVNDVGAFVQWRTAVMHRLNLTLAQIPLGLQLGTHGSPVYPKSARHAMEGISTNEVAGEGDDGEGDAGLLRDFICLPVDKCSQNMAFTCYKHGAEIMMADLHRGGATNPTFVPSIFTPQQITNFMRSAVEHFAGVEGEPVLPVYTFMAKMHKTPIDNRFLSLSYHSFMRPAAMLCTQLMRALFPDTVTLWEQLDFPQGGFNCWVLKNSAQYIATLDDFNASRTLVQHQLMPSMWQFDFKRLYTELSQSDLKQVLFDFIHQVFVAHGTDVLYIKAHGKFKWADRNYRPKPKERKFLPGNARALVDFIIDNAFVQVGGKAFRQVQGIPMGTNPACFFANIYLFMYELAFFRRLLPLCQTNATARRALQAFRWSGRQIDDLQTVSFEPLSFMQQFFYTNQVTDGVQGIYPPDSIQLIPCNPDSGSIANFTDIRITTVLPDGGPLTTYLYDKRREPQFRARLTPCKYPHADTLLSETCKINVFTGQFIRFTRIIRNPGNFICEVANLILCLRDVGHDKSLMLNQCWRMLRERPYLYCVGQPQQLSRRHSFGLYREIVWRANMNTCNV